MDSSLFRNQYIGAYCSPVGVIEAYRHKTGIWGGANKGYRQIAHPEIGLEHTKDRFWQIVCEQTAISRGVSIFI